MEASSFQLGRTQRFAPDIGVLTNLAPDHLDWYDSVEDVLRRQGRLFLNADAREPLGAERRGRGGRAALPGRRAGGALLLPHRRARSAAGERGGFLVARTDG